MDNKIMGKQVSIGVALMTASAFNYNNITKYFKGIVTSCNEDFIELDNKYFISKKFIQIIEII